MGMRVLKEKQRFLQFFWSGGRGALDKNRAKIDNFFNQKFEQVFPTKSKEKKKREERWNWRMKKMMMKKKKGKETNEKGSGTERKSGWIWR